jgi:tRNA pseudouridine32 synthase/23S rRNA pseudouridine746 synthase
MLEDRILFIDGEAIVIDKPAGLPVDEPKRGGDSLACPAARVAARLPAPAGDHAPARPGYVGLPSPRPQPQGASRFQQAFETRQVEKYLSRRVAGEIAKSRGRSTRRWQDIERRSRLAHGRRSQGRQGDHHWRGLAVATADLVEFRP